MSYNPSAAYALAKKENKSKLHCSLLGNKYAKQAAPS